MSNRTIIGGITTARQMINSKPKCIYRPTVNTQINPVNESQAKKKKRKECDCLDELFRVLRRESSGEILHTKKWEKKISQKE